VNALLNANNSSGMFATLFYGVLDLKSRQLDYVNCGHNPPHWRKRAGAWETLKSGGPPIAILPDRTWPQHRQKLERGDALFLFSDGVTEAHNAAGEEYGDARLEALLKDARIDSAQALVQAVMSDVDGFAAGADPFDDITCLAAVLT
jgi:sigma-B regulation protein RsbU (phosphoserine phosphatase)